MEVRYSRIDLDDHVLRAAQCHHDFACLDDQHACKTERFTNKDVEVIRCLDNTPCSKRRSYDGMQICTCPVNRKLHGL